MSASTLSPAKTFTPTDDELRDVFRLLRRNALNHTSESEWLAAVRSNLATWNPRPIDWVEAARIAKTTCRHCAGDGYNIVHGHEIDDCRRCRGKGVMGQTDYRRCWGYDQMVMARAGG